MENTFFTYGIIASIFLIYFALSYKFYILRLGNLEKTLISQKTLVLLNSRHLVGVLLFGVLGYLIFPEYHNLLEFDLANSNTYALILSFFVLVLVILLSKQSAQNKCKASTEAIIQNNEKGWLYFPIRIVFLFTYEYFFRGILFFSLLALMPLIWAILISTVLYVLIHLFDSKPEIIGAIPFGIILCLLTFYTQTIWVPFIIHCALSSVYEISIYNCLMKKTLKL